MFELRIRLFIELPFIIYQKLLEIKIYFLQADKFIQKKDVILAMRYLGLLNI